MIEEKVKHYQDKKTDLDSLRGKIEESLKGDGFKVQSSAPSLHGAVIQAQKGGFLRSIAATDKVFTVLIRGKPDDFTVRVGIGRWLKHLTVTPVEALLLSDLFLLADAQESVWSLEVESKILRTVDSFVTQPVLPEGVEKSVVE